MRKLLVYLIFLLALPIGALAQFTTTTATITDSDAIVWANASVSVQFSPNPSQPNINSYSIGGVLLTSPTYSSYLSQGLTTNSSGILSVTLLDNNLIQPSGSAWYFVIKSNTSAPATSYVPVAVNGASFSLTSYLSSHAIPPRFAAIFNAYGYSDLEVTPLPLPGGFYFNTQLTVQHIWNGISWQTGAASGSAAFPATPGVVYNTNTTSSRNATNTDITGLIGYIPVPPTLTINTHVLSGNFVISASDLTTGTLLHALLPALVSGDIPNNGSNTTGNANTATTAAGISVASALPNLTTAITQSNSDSSTYLSTTGFVKNIISSYLYNPFQTLTTTGSNVPASLNLGVLNIPNYTSPFQSFTTNGSCTASTLISGILNIPPCAGTSPSCINIVAGGGATGNGSTVDGGTINTFLAANPKACIYFPPGTYILNNSGGATGLNIPATFLGTLQFSPGANLSCNTATTSAGVCVLISSLSHIEWYGGNITYTNLGSLPLARVNSTQYTFLTAQNISNVTVKNLNILGSTGSCAWFGPVTNINIEDLTVQNCTADGLHFETAKNVQVNGYTANNTGDDSLAFTSANTNTEVCGGNINNVNITGSKSRGLVVVGGCYVNFNNFYINGTSVSALYAGTVGAYNSTSHVKYSNGFVVGAGTVSGLSGNQYGVEIPGAVSYVDFSNVYISGSQNSCISVSSASYININGITCQGPLTSNGMTLLTCTHCSISNSRIDTTPGYGLYNQSSNDLVVTNLMIRNCYTGGGLFRAFWTSTAAGPVTATGINVVDDQGTSTCKIIGGDTNSSYPINITGVQASIANATFSFAGSGSIQEVYSMLGIVQKAILSGDYTNTTTTFGNVNNFANVALPLLAGVSYSGYCHLVYSASAATAGPQIQFTGPTSPNTVFYQSQFNLSTTTFLSPVQATAFSTAQSAGTSVTTSTNLGADIHFMIVNGSTPGTLQLQAAAQGAGTLIIRNGSYCAMQ